MIFVLIQASTDYHCRDFKHWNCMQISKQCLFLSQRTASDSQSIYRCSNTAIFFIIGYPAKPKPRFAAVGKTRQNAAYLLLSKQEGRTGRARQQGAGIRVAMPEQVNVTSFASNAINSLINFAARRKIKQLIAYFRRVIK